MSSGRINHITSLAGKISVVALVSVYLLFTVGILKATHFCMGREASVVLFSAEAKKCACSSFADEKNSCCDDENDVVRIENEQKSVSSLSLTGPQWIKLEDIYTSQFVALENHDAGQTAHHDLNLFPRKIPLFKVHCSLVFYDDESLLG